MDMLLYIPAPIFADATITVKVQRKPCSAGLSQASFLKKVILIGSLLATPGGCFMPYSIASFICASEGSDPAPPQPASPNTKTAHKTQHSKRRYIVSRPFSRFRRTVLRVNEPGRRKLARKWS